MFYYNIYAYRVGTRIDSVAIEYHYLVCVCARVLMALKENCTSCVHVNVSYHETHKSAETER